MRAAAHAAAAEMRLLAQSYAITNWDAYKAANNISGWVDDNSVPVRPAQAVLPRHCRTLCFLLRPARAKLGLTPVTACFPSQVCLWTGVTCSPEGRIEGL